MPKKPLPTMEVLGCCEMWRMKTFKGLIYTIQDGECEQIFLVFMSTPGGADMCCSCGKQEQSRRCPHIKFLQAYLPDHKTSDRIVEGSLVFLNDAEMGEPVEVLDQQAEQN
jgi:hypothetical protein